MRNINTSNIKMTLAEIEAEMISQKINRNKIVKFIKIVSEKNKKNLPLTNTLRALAPGIDSES